MALAWSSSQGSKSPALPTRVCSMSEPSLCWGGSSQPQIPQHPPDLLSPLGILSVSDLLEACHTACLCCSGWWHRSQRMDVNLSQPNPSAQPPHARKQPVTGAVLCPLTARPQCNPHLEAAQFHVSVLSASGSERALWGSRIAHLPGDPPCAALLPALPPHSCTSVYLGQLEPCKGNGHLQLFLSRLPAQPLGVPEGRDLQGLHTAFWSHQGANPLMIKPAFSVLLLEKGFCGKAPRRAQYSFHIKRICRHAR